jgi:hypothetical protein
MALITDASNIPDERYHTIELTRVEGPDDGHFRIYAANNETTVNVLVGSIALGGEGVGMLEGEVTLDAADSWIRLEHVDFTSQYGYDEVQITFEER